MWQVIIIVALGAVTFGDNIRLAYRRFNSPRRMAVQHRAQKTLAGLLYALSVSKSVDLPYLGASIFRVNRSRITRRQTLERVLRFRINDHPQPTDVKWTKGKGVIGEAWDTKRSAYKYRRSIAKAWAGKQVDEKQFASMPKDTKGRFTREEFVAIVEKYGEVRAVPILGDDGAVLGVLSVDVAMDAPQGKYLDDKQVDTAISAACALVRGDVGRL
ncbi:hypothetical protein [Blastococcus capsensis]|uniref:hypothetical protein n=1 Tax=Blastococcus capsensis TaxID=1564163 RepID=UPI00253FDEE9|nr:hypothetical protein [Blastococcus capsensis]MDK3255752.1 hypothetical protein [Blastococcus capsensis]